MKLFKTMGAMFALGIGGAATANAQAQTQAPKSNLARAITLTGIVGGSPAAGEFFLRANGETFRIKPLAKVGMSGVRGGDRVRVFGRPDGLIISSANVRVLTSRASDNASDYITPNQATTIESRASRRNGGPARSTTNQNEIRPGQNQGSNENMMRNANRTTVNRSGIGVINPGVVTPGVGIAGVGAPGVVGSGVIGSGVVVPNVVVPNVVPGAVAPNTTLNAVNQNAVKAAQPK
ncbi:MAG TPA: hypothetical protein VF627_04655 [Abditibacterium sp.]|jgi:hypothetical protein